MADHPRTPTDPEPTGSRPDFAPPGSDDATQLQPDPARPSGWSVPEPTVMLPAGSRTSVQPAPAMVAPCAPAAPVRKPRSRTVMIVVISVLAVLALLIAGDRVANVVAQNAIATALQTELSTPSKPEVDIGGFPFVTQAVSGSFSSVQVTADNASVRSGETTVEIAHIDATLTDITATDRYTNVVAGHGEATALVDWASVSALAGQEVSYADDGRMRVDFSVPIGRLSIDGYITGRPELNVDDQTITITDPDVALASVNVPQAVVDAVSRVVLRPFPIADLPYDIKVTGLTVQPDGVSLSGIGQNIPLRGQ